MKIKSVLTNTFMESGSINREVTLGWVLKADYDSQNVGDKPQYWSSTACTVSSDQSFSGSKSVKLHINQGEDGSFGTKGGIIKYPNKLYKGDTVWIRARLFFPNGFSFNASPALKFIRNQTFQADGSNRGYNDWYIDHFTAITPNTEYYLNYEGSNHNSPPLPKDIKERWGGASDAPKTGVWQTYETQITLDDKFPSDGGLAVKKRCWIDGTLRFESGEIQTLKSPTDYMDRCLMFTYWNGQGPRTQDWYIDDLIVQSQTPVNRDAAGNPYIGI